MWLCELVRDRDIKFVSVDDASNANIECTFHELPGASWTTRQARAAAKYVGEIIDAIP